MSGTGSRHHDRTGIAPRTAPLETHMIDQKPFDYENTAQALEQTAAAIKRSGRKLGGVAVPCFTSESY